MTVISGFFRTGVRVYFYGQSTKGINKGIR